jgi:histidyl-tRNA synthetase
VVLLGEDEVANGVATVKTFATGEQSRVVLGELVSALSAA